MTERMKRREREEMSEFEPIFAALERDQGYVSRSLFMFGRDPALLDAVGLMHDAAWYSATLDPALRDFAAFAFTMYRGASYSAAHCALNAERHGLPRTKIVSVFAWTTATVYDERERALLAFCFAAASTPGRITDEVFQALARYFDQRAILTLTALLAMMSFLATWNAIMATELEEPPFAYAREVLAPIGWHAGPHG